MKRKCIRSLTKAIFLLCGLVFLACLPSALYAQEEGENKVFQDSVAGEQVLPGKISLDIKGMDIIDVLKILAMRGNLNIVAGQSVRGKVTFFLKDVEIMDALEIILAANELAYEKKDNIINVMSEREYESLYGEKKSDKKAIKLIQLKFSRAVEVGKSLNQIKTKIGKVIVDEGSNTIVLIDTPQRIKQMEETLKSMDLHTETKIFNLNYAKAKDLENEIKDSLTKNIGELKIDERMNKIVVTDLPEKLDYIGKIISTFDERDKVVLIEAKIIQITLDKDLGYGVNWNNVFAGIDTIAASDLSMNLSGVTATSTFTYTRAHGATEYGDQVILRLLEKVGKTNVLSTPRITVANNQEAKVLVGTKEAYVTSTIIQTDGTATTADNVEFVDVGVRLSVVPTISRDGYITMKIKPEVSSAPTSLELTNSDGSIRTSIPIVSTSEAETILSVKDGATIIMAGLIKDTHKDNTDKIPLLGDIPLLGHFFKSRGKEDAKTELVIFLTPHIIEEEEDASAEAQEYLWQHEEARLETKDEPAYNPHTAYNLHRAYNPHAELRSKKKAASVSSEINVFPKNFQDYCNYISDEVNRSIEKNIPPEVKGQQVQLNFMLASDGSLKESPRLLGNDVDERMKDIVIKSVEQATPFFPFPEDHEQEEETFRLTISIETDQ